MRWCFASGDAGRMSTDNSIHQPSWSSQRPAFRISARFHRQLAARWPQGATFQVADARSEWGGWVSTGRARCELRGWVHYGVLITEHRVR